MSASGLHEFLDNAGDTTGAKARRQSGFCLELEGHPDLSGRADDSKSRGVTAQLSATSLSHRRQQGDPRGTQRHPGDTPGPTARSPIRNTLPVPQRDYKGISWGPQAYRRSVQKTVCARREQRKRPGRLASTRRARTMGGEMPEGDVVWWYAGRLRAALAGRVLTRSDFRVPRFATADLTG